MFKFSEAMTSARILSRRYPKRIVRVYETPTAGFWLRVENTISQDVDGIEINHVCAFRDGKPYDD